MYPPNPNLGRYRSMAQGNQVVPNQPQAAPQMGQAPANVAPQMGQARMPAPWTPPPAPPAAPGGPAAQPMVPGQAPGALPPAARVQTAGPQRPGQPTSRQMMQQNRNQTM